MNRNRNKNGRQYRSRRSDARKQAERGNYQDAFADSQKGKKYTTSSKHTVFSSADGDVNNPLWHAPNEQLLKDAASLPYNFVSGIPYIQRVSDAVVYNDVNWKSQPTPGIMTIYLLPTFGKLQHPTDAYNQSMFKSYNYQRQAQSGTAYYQAADQGVYTGAVMSAYLFYVVCCRAYGLLKGWNPTDRYTPQILLQEMGFDYENLVENGANFRFMINFFADKLQSILLPDGYRELDRLVALFGDVYTDAESSKAQYYVFNPVGCYVFAEAEGSNAASHLNFLNFQEYISDDHPLLQYQDLVNIKDTLLTPLINSTVAQRISADILRAYQGKVYKVAGITEDYKITPVYSKEIMSSIENCTILGDMSNLPTVTASMNQDLTDLKAGTYLQAEYSFNISIEKTGVNYTATENPVTQWEKENKLINMHMENPTPGDFMEATRLTTLAYHVDEAVSETDGTNLTVIIDDCGAEVAVAAKISFLKGSEIGVNSQEEIHVKSQSFVFTYTGKTLDTLRQQYYAAVRGAALLATFDWHPMVQYVFVDYLIDTNAHNDISPEIVDLDVFTVVDRDTLSTMHLTSCSGLFDCRTLPSMSR